ncbi:MAG: mechanosensitive ion channel family protein [Desulfobacterales bacterium]|nr:mechanosensitive ion channel family protein [Desulfobacterales bacterium]
MFSSDMWHGVTWQQILISAVIFLVVIIFERLLLKYIKIKSSQLEIEDTKTSWINLFLIAFSRPISLMLWVYGIYWALLSLVSGFDAILLSKIENILENSVDILTVFSIFWFLFRLVKLVDVYLRNWATRTEALMDDILVPLIGKCLRFIIAVIGGIMLVQNMTGIELKPLIASLGIGGLAVALASKESIANFFGTITILFDQPFHVGERITIDKYDGVVESVGLRSTRIRTLSGHLVTIPNEKVVNSSIENVAKRPHIRWLTNIGITYDTPVEKVRVAVQVIRDILENHEGMNSEFPPRVFFNGFNDYSLNITVLAWYHPPDYWTYQAWLQDTCSEIMYRFAEEGINFAFPTQTIHLANDDKRQIKMDLINSENI